MVAERSTLLPVLISVPPETNPEARIRTHVLYLGGDLRKYLKGSGEVSQGRRGSGKRRCSHTSFHCEHLLLSWEILGSSVEIPQHHPSMGRRQLGNVSPSLPSPSLPLLPSLVEGCPGAIPSPARLIGTSNILCGEKDSPASRQKKPSGGDF